MNPDKLGMSATVVLIFNFFFFDKFKPFIVAAFQKIKFGAPHLRFFFDFNFSNRRQMQGKYFFHADAFGHFADGN